MKIDNSVRVESRLWGKYFILTCAGALFYSYSMQILNSNLSLFASETWGSNSLGGLLTTIFNAGSIAMAFFSGRLVDVRGRRNCLVAGSLLFGIPTFACALWPTPAILLAVRLIQGIAKGLITVASSSIVADVVSKSRLAEGIGFYGLASTLAMAFGPMLGLAVVDGGGYSSMFVVCAVLTILTGVAGIWVNYEKKDEYRKLVEERRHLVKEEDKTSAYTGIWKLIEKKALPASINYTVFFASNCCILVFITVYSREILGLEFSRISLFYTVASIFMFGARLFLGKVSDKYGALYTIVPGHIANAVALILLAFFARSYSLYLLAGGLYGMAQAAVMPSMNAVAVVDSPEGRSGAANATFYCLMDIGIMIGSAVFGMVIDSAAIPADGYRDVYLISLAICVLSLTMSILLFNKKARARRIETA